jgi:hypothetical protein
MPDAGVGKTRNTPDTREGLRVLQGVLASVQGVVGEGAAQALFRYGAFEEGKRLAMERSGQGIEDLVDEIARLVRIDGEVKAANRDHVEVEIHSSDMLAEDSPILDTLMLGLMEGLIAGIQGGRLRGQIVSRGGNGSGSLVFRPDTE